MKKQEYVTKISEKLKMTKKDVEAVTDEFIKVLCDTLDSKESVSITKFGTFKKTITKSYSYFSPINGEKKVKENMVKVTFSLSKDLSNRLSKGGEK